MKSKELRIGNWVERRSIDGRFVEYEKVSELKPTEEYGYFSHTSSVGGILLTEENILKLRRVERSDFKPIEFDKRPPCKRQVENHYWSNWINEDYKLCLSPSYGANFIERKVIKQPAPEFWFCWYHSAGEWFLPLGSIRGDNQLKYVHQLQNLFFVLTGKELDYFDIIKQNAL